MAELGAVAAVMQLAETACKLWNICSEIRDGPAELLVVVEEVKHLADLLAEIGQVNHHQTNIGDRCWERCYEHVKTSLRVLSQVTGEMAKTLDRHKTTGALRIRTKRHDLIKYQARLERVKSSMIIAQQAYSSAVLSKNTTLLQEVYALATAQNSQVILKQDDLIATAANGRHILATRPCSAQQSQTPDKKQVNRYKIAHQSHNLALKYDLSLPRWVYSKGIQILFNVSLNSWGMTIRCYNQLPPNSKVFKAATCGDWLQVKDLFVCGEASPFDIDGELGTLLHVAIDNGDALGCRFLLDCGSDPSNEVGGHTRPAASVGRFFGPFGERNWSKGAKTFSVLSAAFPNLFGDSDEELFSLIIKWLSREVLLTLFNNVATPYSQVGPEKRAINAMGISTTDAKALYALLGPDLSLHRACELTVDHPTSNHFRLLEHALFCIASVVHRGEDVGPLAKDWSAVIGEMLAFASSNDNRCIFTSLLVYFIALYSMFWTSKRKKHRVHYTGSWNEFLTAIGRIWITVLAELGANLKRYGAIEKRCIYSNPYKHDNVMLYHVKHRELKFRIFSILYGPVVEDWKVFAVPTEEYDMAGEFWNFIENPELFEIPGSWTSEYEDDDSCNDGPYCEKSSLPVNGPIF